MSCIVCLDSEGTIKSAGCDCQTLYCEPCLIGWLSINPTCSTCRTKFVLPEEFSHLQEKIKKSEKEKESQLIPLEVLISLARFALRSDDEQTKELRRISEFLEIVRDLIHLLNLYVDFSQELFDEFLENQHVCSCILLKILKEKMEMKGLALALKKKYLSITPIFVIKKYEDLDMYMNQSERFNKLKESDRMRYLNEIPNLDMD